MSQLAVPKSARFRRASKSYAGRPTETGLIRARWLVGVVIAITIFQDLLWFSVSRFVNLFWSNSFFYIEAPISALMILYFSLVIIVCSVMSFPIAHLVGPIRRFEVGRRFLIGLIIIAVILNILVVTLIQSNARYVSGSLVGGAGVLFFLSTAFNFGVMSFLIRARFEERQVVSLGLVLAFSTSLLIRIDGLSSVLTIFIFFVLMIGKINISRSMLAGVVCFALLSVGLITKFADATELPDPVWLISWIVKRFAIQAESAYGYLSGYSIIEGTLDYWNITFQSFTTRLQIVLGESPTISYPRNVSEALFFDIRGVFLGGSSPGMAGTLIMNGFLSPLVIVFYAFILIQFFHSFRKKVALIHILLFVGYFRAIFADFSETITIISQSSFITLFVFLSCTIKIK